MVSWPHHSRQEEEGGGDILGNGGGRGVGREERVDSVIGRCNLNLRERKRIYIYSVDQKETQKKNKCQFLCSSLTHTPLRHII